MRRRLLRSVLDQHPHLDGTLVDLPDVIETVAATNRLRLHPADFFTDRLPDADVSMLMHIVHDWDDDHAARILGAVAAANTPSSTS